MAMRSGKHPTCKPRTTLFNQAISKVHVYALWDLCAAVSGAAVYRVHPTIIPTVEIAAVITRLAGTA
jgi:hypothetical protein